MDATLIYEVLLEKGYIYIYEACFAFLFILLILKKVLPQPPVVEAPVFTMRAHKLFLEEGFDASIEITAKRKILIDELYFFVECFVEWPNQSKRQVKKSIFFKKTSLLSRVPLYPKCSIHEGSLLRVPERDKDRYLPGTFTSSRGNFRIYWEAGFTLIIKEPFRKIMEKQAITVYPVTGGW
jgi:hypothetical protein